MAKCVVSQYLAIQLFNQHAERVDRRVSERLKGNFYNNFKTFGVLRIMLCSFIVYCIVNTTHAAVDAIVTF